MKGLAVIVVMALFIFGMVALAISLDTKQAKTADSWCSPRGYQMFAVRGRNLCVDPKTRIVYLPEV